MRPASLTTLSASAAALELLAQLADKLRRPAAAEAVAAAVGCEEFYILVFDRLVDVFVPAPGFAQTLPSVAWSAVLDCCKTAGQHRLDLAHGDAVKAATIRCASNAALVFVGEVANAPLADVLAEALPVIAAMFANEQAAAAAAGQLRVAQDAARHARTLSAALSTARADMERALADAARLNVELREGDRRKDEFLAMLAHELRNPLSPIMTALQLVSVRRERNEPFDHELEVMSRQLSHMARLVDDLLDVSRITRGRIDLRIDTIRLA
ncbi:MAG: hypothetical protein LC659_15105, partial [Myxococcales bacterium]|nr:hypothetical protein [Myxococcales bacterium]